MRVIEKSSAEVEQGAMTRFLEGIEQGASLVQATYGEFGGNVMVAGGHERQIFDDGFKAISALVPTDEATREGVFYLRDVAKAQRDSVGDGTSTAMLLASRLILSAMNLRHKGGISPKLIADVFEQCKKDAISSLKSLTTPAASADIIKKVAKLSMHSNQEWGDLVGQMVFDAGRYGAISFVQSRDSNLSGEINKGISWPAGVADVGLLRDQEKVSFRSAKVLMYNGSIEDITTSAWRNIINSYQYASGSSAEKEGFVIVCTGAGGNFLSTAVKNQDWTIVRVPTNVHSALFFADLRELVGGIVYDDLRGNLLEKFTPDGFGHARNFWASRTNTCITGIDNDAILDRQEALKSFYPNIDEASPSFAEYSARMAMLSGGFGEIKVPAMSDVAFSAAKEVLEDGYFAAREALKGVVAGGGYSLFNVGDRMIPHDLSHKEDAEVAKIRAHFANTLIDVACMARGIYPAGVGDERLSKFLKSKDLYDPASVIINAIEVATSVAVQVVNTNQIIVKKTKNAVID